MSLSKVVTRQMQRYWRRTRGLTLGAQGCVLDRQNHVLLVRTADRPGWHFPGGDLAAGEEVLAALTRVLAAQSGIILDGRPELFGLYGNSRERADSHIALYVVRDWYQSNIVPRNGEAAEQHFFSVEELPHDINPPTAARINEILGHGVRSDLW